ncbi:MAG: zinc ribbon domain-containing protein, partial [Prevotella sp.]|nr:zinc ribbon domain-containing protein [Prevotella sp.]
IDSVWVQVARDQSTFGWIHESEMLPCVVPNDPISQFISIFSDIHLLIFLIIISVISIAYLMRTISKRNAKIVHFNDINSFYPTALALVVALSATLYASIQRFVPDLWLHFYYHPTLNPFIVPPILSVFLVTVWAILIIGIATIDVVRSLLSAGNAFLYLCGLVSVCAVNYIVFSITTLYYVGYGVFVAYFFYSFYRYHKNN